MAGASYSEKVNEIKERKTRGSSLTQSMKKLTNEEKIEIPSSQNKNYLVLYVINT